MGLAMKIRNLGHGMEWEIKGKAKSKWKRRNLRKRVARNYGTKITLLSQLCAETLLREYWQIRIRTGTASF